MNLLTGTLLAVLITGLPQDDKVKVLIVDGQNNHDWKATTTSTKATLEKTGRFDVDVSTSPGKRAKNEDWDAWRPEFSKVDVVLGNYNGRAWPEEVKESFLKFVKGGGGVVFVHAANNAFTGWEEYNKLIGLGWRGAGFGARISLDEEGKVVRTAKGKGPGAGHGRQHEFLVTVRKPDHPIMKGIPATWMHGKDELYHGQRGPAEDMTVLSSAFSDKKTGGTGTNEPITWLIPYGKGKVITTVMGHHWSGQKDFDALSCVGFQTILARSVEWLGSGKVTIPVPDNFPGKDKTSLADPK